MSDYSTPPAKRPRISRSDLLREPREELVERCLKLQASIESTSQKQHNDDFLQLKELNEKLKSQLTESAQRESILVMRLTGKEQEVQDLLAQLHESKESRCPGSAQLQSLLLDPSVNILFENFKKELDTCKTQLKQAQDDLAAFKFTPESHIGKRLMAKCRLLLNENEELGRAISSGSVAKLESTIAMEKKFVQEMRRTEKDTEYFLHDMNDEMEGLQATVYQLQQSLKETQEQLHEAQEENKRLRTTLPSGTSIPVEVSGGSQAALQGVLVEATKAELSSKETSRVKRTLSSSTNARAKSRHLEKKDTGIEKTICKAYKTSSQNRTTSSSSSGNHERTAATVTAPSSDKTSRVRQTDVSDSKMPGAGGNATVPTHPEESSNGNRNSEKLEPVASSETHDNSVEKSRSSNERENQKQRTGVSSSKLDSATNDLANGLINKHNTLPDTCQKT